MNPVKITFIIDIYKVFVLIFVEFSVNLANFLFKQQLHMKKLIVFFIGLSTILHAQKMDITLEDIWKKGTFRSDYMNSLNSMNGDFYSLLNYQRGGTSVDKYNYQTLEKVAL